MRKIGLLSDTHGYWDERFEQYFSVCDEIWHVGDFGTEDIADRLQAIAPLRGVYGNIDGSELRRRFPETTCFETEGVRVLMKHIGGYPGRYDSTAIPYLYKHRPRLFITGHSHILKVQYDKRLQLLHINPGAAGRYGAQAVRTLVRFVLNEGNIADLEVIELR